MSTMLLTAPLATRRPSPRQRPALRVVTAPAAARRPARVRPAPVQPAPVQPAQVHPVSVRLTARGRAVATGLLVVLALAVLLLTTSVSGAGTSSTPVPVRHVVVEPGQTLWQIAGDVAPDADRRDTVAAILELNALPGSNVQAGQQIAVPAAS